MAKPTLHKIAELGFSVDQFLYSFGKTQTSEAVGTYLSCKETLGKLSAIITIFTRWYFPTSQKNQEI